MPLVRVLHERVEQSRRIRSHPAGLLPRMFGKNLVGVPRRPGQVVCIAGRIRRASRLAAGSGAMAKVRTCGRAVRNQARGNRAGFTPHLRPLSPKGRGENEVETLASAWGDGRMRYRSLSLKESRDGSSNPFSARRRPALRALGRLSRRSASSTNWPVRGECGWLRETSA